MWVWVCVCGVGGSIQPVRKKEMGFIWNGGWGQTAEHSCRDVTARTSEPTFINHQHTKVNKNLQGH